MDVVEAEVAADGSVTSPGSATLQHTSIPYTLVRSKDQQLGGWAESTLFDGFEWIKDRCSIAPSICQSMRSPQISLCVGPKMGLPPEEVAQLCATDIVVSLVQLQPGTRVLSNCGATNRHLVMSWCLAGCEGVQIAVGGETKTDFAPGNAVVYDSSFEHSIHHTGPNEAYFVQAIFAHPEVKKLTVK